MSQLQYHSYPGFGQRALENTHYSQAVIVPTGPTIQISGQGGWDRETGKMRTDVHEEIDQALANVDHTLKDAGGKGMDQVYKLVVYMAPHSDELTKVLVEGLRKWFPNHAPILTGIGIDKLAVDGMRVEIEAYAYLE